MWDLICLVLEQINNESVIVAGDFNAIRATLERRGRMEENEERYKVIFNEFIN